MTPSVRTLKGSKTKGFRGSPLLCPRGSNARGFSSPFSYSQTSLIDAPTFSLATIACLMKRSDAPRVLFIIIRADCFIPCEIILLTFSFFQGFSNPSYS